MHRPKLALLAVAVVAATAGALGGVALRGGPGAHADGSVKAVVGGSAAQALQNGFAPAGDTAGMVRRLQARLVAVPGDAHSLTMLGLAYQQRARETGDPAYYALSAGVLARALQLEPGDMEATSGLGSLALSRHRFRDALALGRRAVAASPATARNYGVMGDALIELGRYPEAFRAFDRMEALRPGLSSYARTSYARELRGDHAGAVRAMRLAVDAAEGEPEPMAWTRVQLGKLELNGNRAELAERSFREALAIFPGYVFALDQLALVEAAKGQLAEAIRLEGQAVERIPLPQFVGSLGDLYARAGNTALARKQQALMGVIDRLLAANGVRTDLESVVYDADHGIAMAGIVARARAARAARPSIDGDDGLGWALTRSGRCAEGLVWARRSLRLGTRDPLKLFHLGMAQRCAGQDAAGRASIRAALALNPSFSVLWAPLAHKVAA